MCILRQFTMVKMKTWNKNSLQCASSLISIILVVKMLYVLFAKRNKLIDCDECKLKIFTKLYTVTYKKAVCEPCLRSSYPIEYKLHTAKGSVSETMEDNDDDITESIDLAQQQK